MKTKLTITVDRDLVPIAKRYAKSHNTSLSQLIEDNLRAVVTQESSEKGVQSLAGLLKKERRKPVTLDEMDEAIRKAHEQ